MLRSGEQDELAEKNKGSRPKLHGGPGDHSSGCQRNRQNNLLLDLLAPYTALTLRESSRPSPRTHLHGFGEMLFNAHTYIPCQVPPS